MNAGQTNEKGLPVLEKEAFTVVESPISKTTFYLMKSRRFFLDSVMPLLQTIAQLVKQSAQWLANKSAKEKAAFGLALISGIMYMGTMAAGWPDYELFWFIMLFIFPISALWYIYAVILLAKD